MPLYIYSYSRTPLLIQTPQNLFLMEAVWTRYFPLSAYVRDIITSDKLGTVNRVFADLSQALNPSENYADGKNRMVNIDLAGTQHTNFTNPPNPLAPFSLQSPPALR